MDVFQMVCETLIVRALPTARLGRIADYEPSSTEMKHTAIKRGPPISKPGEDRRPDSRLLLSAVSPLPCSRNGGLHACHPLYQF
jgi:hypothetical protein